MLAWQSKIGENMHPLKGSCVALVTPFTTNNKIDWNSLESLIEWHITEGTNALVIAGTTGESPTLSLQEQEDLFKFVVSKTKNRIPVVAGTGTNCTKSTIERTQMAQKCGVDAVLTITPYYNKPPQSGLIEHFTLIAKNTNLPVYLYNHPGRTGCLIEATTIAKLSLLSNICGVKDATGTLTEFNKLKDICPKDFVYLSGDDNTAFDFVKNGGQGVISVTANVLPKKMSACMNMVLEGLAEAKQLDDELQTMHAAMNIMINPLPVKCLLNLMNKIEAKVRLPLVWPSVDVSRQLNEIGKSFALV
jgi:4-hydroxy-tetrahydrodipicolinate synthase